MILSIYPPTIVVFMKYMAFLIRVILKKVCYILRSISTICLVKDQEPSILTTSIISFT